MYQLAPRLRCGDYRWFRDNTSPVASMLVSSTENIFRQRWSVSSEFLQLFKAEVIAPCIVVFQKEEVGTYLFLFVRLQFRLNCIVPYFGIEDRQIQLGNVHLFLVHPGAICSRTVNDCSYEEVLGEILGFKSLTHHTLFHLPSLCLTFGHLHQDSIVCHVSLAQWCICSSTNFNGSLSATLVVDRWKGLCTIVMVTMMSLFLPWIRLLFIQRCQNHTSKQQHNGYSVSVSS